MASEARARVEVARPVKLTLPRPNGMVLLAMVPAVLIVGLLGVTLWISVREGMTSAGYTLRHYTALYSEPAAYRAFLNTIGFALTTDVVALAIGVPAAWLVERTDLRGKSVVYTGMALGLLIPGFFTAMGWQLLLHPRIGMLNQIAMSLFGLPSGPINIATIPGMGWVQGLSLGSLVFMMTTSSLRAMDSSLEESAQTSGASFLTTLRRITLPLIFPSVLAAGVFVLTIGISAFDVPLIIGAASRVFTFSTYLYFQTTASVGTPNYGLAAAFASFMLVLAVLLSWWYGRVLVQARKYQVITGKGYQPRLVRLGRWWIAAWLFVGGYLLLSKVLPLLLLAWSSSLSYLQAPSLQALQAVSFLKFTTLPWELIGRGLSNTAILMLVGPTLALTFSLIISWVVLRSRNRFRLAFDYLSFLPQVVPSVVFSLGALLVALFVIRGPVDLYGSLVLLIIVLAIVQLSLGTRFTNSALIQIHAELEEAAYVSGASIFVTLRRVVVPLLKPALVNGWLWLALLAFRELTIAMMLFSPQNITLSVVVWSIWMSGDLTQAAAVALLMVGLMLPLIVAYWRVAGRTTIDGGR